MSRDRFTRDPQRWIALADIGHEPYRVFFPAGVVAGIAGVSLWPLYFAGATANYPGEAHARLMAFGLFGGFIFGFLGTALPRMLSAPPLGARNVFLLLTLHIAAAVAFAHQHIWLGNSLFLIFLTVFILSIGIRLRQRQDLPPPGFVLVALGLVGVFVATAFAVVKPWLGEIDGRWVLLERLLSYQGFVLLPILGVGPFLLPRVFGLPSSHDFPETMMPAAAWSRKAARALITGGIIIGSFFLEGEGWFRSGHAVRFAVTLIFVLIEFPLHQKAQVKTALGISLRIAFAALMSGFLLVAIFPMFRVSLLHLTLIGGFAVVAFVVATRVVFGHSGNLEELNGRNRWLVVAVSLMLLGMATRMSGDFWPPIIVSHYTYGALLWIAGVLIWAGRVLPKLFLTEAD